MRRVFDRFLVLLDRLILGIFFREIEVVGGETVPATGPLLVVSNHGNSLVDPMLIFGFLPRPSRFLAKSTLWRHPGAKYMVRLAAAIPVHRRQDAGADRSKNIETFARSHEELAAGGIIALFPEGVSHSEPALLPLKTGVARIALGAEKRFGPLGLSILPVGLNFEEPEAFRSRVLIRIGEPLPVNTVAASGAPRDEKHEKHEVRELTKRVEEALRGVTLNYDSWRQAELLDCAAEVHSRGVVAAPRRTRLSDQFALKKAFLDGYRELERLAPEAIEPVLAATESYDDLLRSLRLEDRHVAARYPGGLIARFLLRHLWSLTIWRPLAFLGVIFNWLPYKIPAWVIRWVTLKPDVRATWKVLLSLVLFPCFWILAAGLVGWRFGVSWGLVTLVVAPATGYFALTYSETWAVLRDEGRAFLTLHGRRAAAGELERRRLTVVDEIRKLIAVHERLSASG